MHKRRLKSQINILTSKHLNLKKNVQMTFKLNMWYDLKNVFARTITWTVKYLQSKFICENYKATKLFKFHNLTKFMNFLRKWILEFFSFWCNYTTNHKTYYKEKNGVMPWYVHYVIGHCDDGVKVNYVYVS
jgi:hypothetical protein